MVKKAACIHDISCYGRCSMKVVFPILSAYGVEVCPLPTSLLSTHTGGYTGYSFDDLSGEMDSIIAHWHSLSLSFDAVYSGFLGSEKQIDTVSGFIDLFPAQLVLVDPVMGDCGVRYKTYTHGMCRGMSALCEKGDIITPNLTEAYILTEGVYNPHPDIAEVYGLLDSLGSLIKSRKPFSSVIITGIHNESDNTIGVAVLELATGRKYTVFAPYCDTFFPGCGDVLASALTGAVLNGDGLEDSLGVITRFISEASLRTAKLGTDPREGIVFEDIAYKLHQPKGI